MKAQIKPRINLDNRTKLQEVIPLSTPITIFIDPSSLCNFKCKFCPSGYSELIRETGRYQGLMKWDLYKQIIDDLSEFDAPINTIHMYKEGEPLLNSKLAHMIKYAKDSNCVDYIDTTTNGFLINKERMKPIINAGLDKINISVNGLSDEQIYDFSGCCRDFDKYVRNIKILYEIKKDCEIVIKTTGDFLSEDDKIKFYDTFGDYCDRIFIENAMSCWSDFDVEEKSNIKISNNKGIYNQEIETINEVQTCPYIFYSTTINSDGGVSLCFLDWQHKLIIGDVRNQSLREIWNGNLLYHYRILNLTNERKNIPICKNCKQLLHGLPDNIDPYIKDLKEKLIKRRI